MNRPTSNLESGFHTFHSFRAALILRGDKVNIILIRFFFLFQWLLRFWWIHILPFLFLRFLGYAYINNFYYSENKKDWLQTNCENSETECFNSRIILVISFEQSSSTEERWQGSPWTASTPFSSDFPPSKESRSFFFFFLAFFDLPIQQRKKKMKTRPFRYDCYIISISDNLLTCRDNKTKQHSFRISGFSTLTLIIIEHHFSISSLTLNFELALVFHFII